MKNSKVDIEEMIEDLKSQSNGKTVLSLQEASLLSGISQMTLRRAIWERTLKATQPRGRNSKYIISLRNLARFILGEAKV